MKLPFTSEESHGLSEPQEDPTESRQGAAADQNRSEGQMIPGLTELYVPKEAGRWHVLRIADVLLEMGKITDHQHQQLQEKLAERPESDAAALLLKEGLASAEDILLAKTKLYGLEFRHIKPDEVDKDALKKLDVSFIENNKIVPIATEADTLVVATCEPANVFTVEEMKRRSQMDVRLVVCTEAEFDAICELSKGEKLEVCLDDIMQDMTEVKVIQETAEDEGDLEKMAGESPVIRFVNYLISSALHDGASDIHIEPKKRSTKIRYRIDGVLFETMQPPAKMHAAIVSRIKIMSNLDISERRVPQDGKIAAIVGGRAVDLRISTLPTTYGEKVVIRILDSSSIMRGLEQLGMEPDTMAAFHEQIERPHGILLVTGPTGSGKSTTLYTALCQMDGDKMNISTVEDPVEYQLGFCSQVQVNEKAGLDFASALRSLLRQDPDIVMIGEIRDYPTARIAVQAALTGHLVLSTLHTNDAAGSVTRLVDIGVEAYLIAASLNGVLAQRLVRKICPKCKEAYKPPANIVRNLEKIGVDTTQIFAGRGCEDCRGSGYSGRIGIYEMLVIDSKFRDMINKDPSVENMRTVFRENSGISLFEDGIRKVKQGLTTIDEVLRVTEASDHLERKPVENTRKAASVEQ
ncbi:MAG: Flp pilus assembly complex ATPase component TadA [Sedimentisphaerales bacterium]|nr:Flp pilus assembly complex ATPase component TadA [Sedimentisphaerales bacterium]